MGRRMDDAGADTALSAVRHIGNRQRAADKTRRRAVVSAVAVCTLARRQRGLSRILVATHHLKDVAVARKPALYWRVGSMTPDTEDVNDALENSSRWSRSPADRFVGGCRDAHRRRGDRSLHDRTPKNTSDL